MIAELKDVAVLTGNDAPEVEPGAKTVPPGEFNLFMAGRGLAGAMEE